MRTPRATKTITKDDLFTMTGIDPETLITWDYAKTRILPRLVDIREKAYIEHKPHTYAADIPVIYYVPISEDNETMASMPVTDDLVNLWNVTIEEIDTAARHNATAVLSTLNGIMTELTGIDYPEVIPDFFVLTNKAKHHGAAAILNTGIMDTLSERLGTLAIIPSSIHEVLILKYDPEQRDFINMMINDINGDKSVMDEDDILSDHLYLYDTVEGFRAA